MLFSHLVTHLPSWAQCHAPGLHLGTCLYTERAPLAKERYEGLCLWKWNHSHCEIPINMMEINMTDIYDKPSVGSSVPD